MKNILVRILSGETLLADGAMGTMLIERGLKPGDCPEFFNIEKPEILTEIARLYIEAGADLVQTNTFGASPLKLENYKLQDKTEEINKNAVKSAKAAAAGKNVYIYASCGPSGRLLKPYGDTEPEAMAENYQKQLSAILEEGVDAVCVETMTGLEEATIAVKAAKSISPTTPVFATMTFDKTPRGYFTIMGVNVIRAVNGLESAGADVIGSNCGNGILNMIEIAQEFKKYSRLPLIIQSNAGLPELRNGQTFYPETPEFMSEKVRELLDIGVSIIGGCCGTGPEHIKAFRLIIDTYKNG